MSLSDYWEDYLTQLEKKPVQTKALTAASLSVVSDVIAQTMTGTPLAKLDLASLRHQFLIGLVIRGPLIHYWYQAMERAFRAMGFTAAEQSTTPVVLGKVALDQIVFSPPFNLLYFYVIGFLKGTPSLETSNQVRNQFVDLMIANYKVWPLINLINFKFVPAKLQVLFGNLVSIAWMAYVIKMTAGKK